MNVKRNDADRPNEPVIDYDGATLREVLNVIKEKAEIAKDRSFMG
jgi:hypothetical protein